MHCCSHITTDTIVQCFTCQLDRVWVILQLSVTLLSVSFTGRWWSSVFFRSAICWIICSIWEEGYKLWLKKAGLSHTYKRFAFLWWHSLLLLSTLMSCWCLVMLGTLDSHASVWRKFQTFCGAQGWHLTFTRFTSMSTKNALGNRTWTSLDFLTLGQHANQNRIYKRHNHNTIIILNKCSIIWSWHYCRFHVGECNQTLCSWLLTDWGSQSVAVLLQSEKLAVLTKHGTRWNASKRAVSHTPSNWTWGVLQSEQ